MTLLLDCDEVLPDVDAAMSWSAERDKIVKHPMTAGQQPALRELLEHWGLSRGHLDIDMVLQAREVVRNQGKSSSAWTHRTEAAPPKQLRSVTMVNCRECGAETELKHGGQRYCGKACYSKAYHRREREAKRK